MKLSDVKQILTLPLPNREAISSASVKESQLQILTENLSKEQLAPLKGWKLLLKDMENVLTTDKFNQALKFASYPLPILDITDEISKIQNKIFSGKNSEFKITTKNKSFNKALDKIDIPNWIKDNGKEVLKNKPNSIVILDKSAGEPLLLRIDTDRLLGIDYDGEAIKWVFFEHSKGLYAFYDEQSYKIFSKEDSEYIFEYEVPHNLGYCPAKHFLKEKANSENEYERINNYSSSVSKMNRWTAFDMYLAFTDHYTSFPIVERIKEDCEDTNCHDGVVREPFKTDRDTEEFKIYDCQLCAKKSILGAGSEIQIPQRDDKDEPTDSGVFRFINPPLENNEYLIAKLDRIQELVSNKVLGIVGSITSVNEMQLKGDYEERQDKFLSLKDSFEDLHKWILDSLSTLYRVNDLVYIIDYGTEFYLVSVNELSKRYDAAKLSGLPPFRLDTIYSQIINTTYKGDGAQISRQLLINAIDPFPYETFEEVNKKHLSNTVSQLDFVIKANFVKFVRQIELEVGDISSFGIKLETAKRVEALLGLLNAQGMKYIANLPTPIKEEPTKKDGREE